MSPSAVTRRPLIVTVDGPAASGKTTLARRLAAAFDLPFLDTGLLYRAVARRLLEAERAADDAEAAAAMAAAITSQDLDPDRVQSAEIGQGASIVAALPAVRAALLDVQRRFGADGPGAVLAGRDVGTVVRPDARCKIFATASLEERAQRRCRELQGLGMAAIYRCVLDELRERDERDRTRSVAPLVPAEDAFVIDTTELDADAAFAAARDHVARVTRG